MFEQDNINNKDETESETKGKSESKLDEFMNIAKSSAKDEIRDELIKKAVDKRLDEMEATIRFKTSKKFISIKVYPSGWGGGSPLKITTYLLGGVLKKVFHGVMSILSPVKSLIKNGINSEEFFGSVGSALTSAAAGAAAGSIFPGLGTVGGFVVGLCSSVVGDIGGEYLGKYIYGRTHNIKGEEKAEETNNKSSKELSGKGKTGGIEFEIPDEIKGFKHLLFFGKLTNQNIIFNCNFSEIEEILNVGNRFLIDKNNNFTSINQLFQTILTEIYGGFIGQGVLPYVSLNFNNKSLLYSIMPNYYKKTLVGNILGFLDYFLKGFVNGGFFKEDFVQKWYLDKNEDFEYLNSNFISLKKYIYHNKSKIKTPDIYLTVYDLGETISDEENNNIRKNTLSAFRIIGMIDDNIYVNDNIIIPKCTFRTESDYNLFPGYLSEKKEQNNLIEDNKEIEKTQEAIKNMKVLISLLMPQIPYFRGYFNILDMITFSIHYISTLDQNAVYPNFSQSLLIKSNGKPYATLFPPVFPPLPIKKQIIINVNINFSYAIKNFLDINERNALNKILSESALNNAEIDFTKIEIILNKLENKYKNYLYNLFDNKDELEYRTKRELHIDEFIKNTQSILKILSQTPKQLYIQLFLTLKKSVEDIIKRHKEHINFEYKLKSKDINESENIETITKKINFLMDECNSVSNKLKYDLKNLIENNINKEKDEIFKKIEKSKNEAINKEISNLENQIITVKNKSIDDSIRKMEENLNKQKEEALKNIPYYNRNEASAKIDKEISRIKSENSIKIRNDIETHFNDLKNKEINNIINNKEMQSREMKQKANNELNKQKIEKEKLIEQDMMNLNKYFKEKNDEILDIKKALEEKNILKYGNIFDKQYLVEKINLNLIGYYQQKKNSEKNTSFAPIRGGCLSEINNKLNLVDISESQNEEFNQIIKEINNNKNSKMININGNNFYKINLNLFQGYLNENFCNYYLNFNGDSEIKIINAIEDNENINTLDEYKNSIGTYKMVLNESDKIKSIKELTNKNIFGENSAFYLNNEEDIDKINSLGAQSIFEAETENDLNPFLISIMNKKRDVCNSLIDHISLSKINSCDESRYTPLHFACLYNYYELADALIKKGANINVKTRNSNYTPLDILIMEGNYETLELLLNNKEFANLINEKNYLNSTPFHSACLESILCTKLIMKYGKKIKDSNGNLPEHYSLFGGRIDIYNLISNSDIKEFKDYINSIRTGYSENLNEESLNELSDKNKFVDNLYDNLNKGNINNIKKIVKYYLKNSELKKEINLEKYSDKIIYNICKGRNSNLLSLLNEIINYDKFPIAAYVGKFGLISYIEEMKNMNIDMFSELEGKNLLDFAIENKNEDMIKEFFKNIEEISDDTFSKYMAKILFKSKKLFNSVYSFIINQEKFKKNKLNFDYFYNEHSLFYHFKIFLRLNHINKNSLDLKKVEETCRDSVILELNKLGYKIEKNILKEKNEKEKIEFEKILEKNSDSKYNFEIFEHDVEKLKKIFTSLNDYNLFLPHQIIKSKKIWMLKYLPKKLDLFLKNDEGKVCFSLISEDFEDFQLILDIFKLRENKKEKQMLYFLKAIEIYINKCIKNCKKTNIEIILKKKFIKLIELFEVNKTYIFNYCNENNNNILHILSNFFYMDKEMESKFISFLELIEKNLNKNEFKDMINQQNNFGNIFLFNLLDNNHNKLSKEILEKYFNYFDLSIRNYSGDTFLHYLMIIKCYNKNIFNFIIEIIKFNKYYIITENNHGLTPFHLAAYNKCNDSLALMTNYFPLEQIDLISKKGSILHYAAITNSLTTLRLIIEIFKIDINSQINNKENNYDNIKKEKYFNLPDKSTPIYCAGYFSCVDSFDYLLSLGADPFIQDSYGNDAIDAALIHGNRKMVEYISKTYSFINSNGKYFLSLVKNVQARNVLYNNISLLGQQHINITEQYQKNLLMLSIENKNHKIIPFLLNNNINIENKDKFGRNVLHYCVNMNDLSSLWIILSYLNTLNKKRILGNLLFDIDDSGESVLYSACKLGRLEIVYFILFFYKINNFEKRFTINHIGLLPIHVAIINGFNTIALLLKNFFKRNDIEISNVSEQYIDKIKNFLNADLKKETKKCEEIIIFLESQVSNFKNIPNIKNGINLLQEENITLNFQNYDIFKKIIDLNLSKNNFVKYQELFSNNLIIIFALLVNNENNRKNVENFFEIISSIKIDTNIKLSAQWEMLKLFTIYIIPKDYYKLDKINETLAILLSNKTLMNLSISHPIFSWIKSIIISACEGSVLVSVEDLFDILIKFINFICRENEYLNNLNFVKLSMKSFQFVHNLNKMLLKLDKDFGVIQIKYMNCIPPLLEEEVDILLNKYKIIHHDYNNRTPIYSFVQQILSDTNISPKLLESGLIASNSIIKSCQINYISKEEILSFCKYIYNKYNNDENLPDGILSISSISENLCSKFGYNIYKNIILKSIHNNIKNGKIKTIKDIKNIFNEFLQIHSIEHINHFCELLNKYSLSIAFEKIKQITNIKEGRNINELLIAFEKEAFPLSKEELVQLELFEKEFNRCQEYNQTEFIEEGKLLGNNFKEVPSIENFAKLVKIVNCGIYEVLKIKPYLIQNLIVLSFYLHYININQRSSYRGRLGQILTGEGKSLIIAEMALISALMGEFVDIITSTSYLAKRDQIKFKELYNIFGISSNSITENNPSKEAYNGIILYGTNTDFEFTLLREGTNSEEKMFTVPLGQKVAIKRKFQTVIVDESDNLFIDTALNSARISYTSRNHFNWVYYPIFKCVKNNMNNVEIVRKELEKINSKETKKISDEQLNSWISKAHSALNYKKGENYVVRYNPQNKKKEVQIIQLSTGRVNIGSRWVGGLHEFVEVKEGLEPETESNTIASISHPSFFNNYNIIFGLTGTIGSTIERDEILNIYKLDSFDVPPNFASKRKIYPASLYENKEQKEENIINHIRQKIKEGRPVLILLLTIEDTINFSNKLKKEGIDNLILNDIQKEKEEYIILYAGKPRSVVVATNAAGRGTDIILSEDSLNFGGLHVIMGFYPENNRVEFQGIGRAGRQGQIGSAEVIFSKDEKFFENENISSVENAELYRISKLKTESQIRFISSLFEICVYDTLKKFFDKLKELKMIFENENFKILFNDICQNKLIDYDTFKNEIIENFKVDWAEYFEEISKRNSNLTSNFDLFLKKYNWENIDIKEQNKWKYFILKKLNKN